MPCFHFNIFLEKLKRQHAIIRDRWRHPQQMEPHSMLRMSRHFCQFKQCQSSTIPWSKLVDNIIAATPLMEDSEQKPDWKFVPERKQFYFGETTTGCGDVGVGVGVGVGDQHFVRARFNQISNHQFWNHKFLQRGGKNLIIVFDSFSFWRMFGKNPDLSSNEPNSRALGFRE